MSKYPDTQKLRSILKSQGRGSGLFESRYDDGYAGFSKSNSVALESDLEQHLFRVLKDQHPVEVVVEQEQLGSDNVIYADVLFDNGKSSSIMFANENESAIAVVLSERDNTVVDLYGPISIGYKGLTESFSDLIPEHDLYKAVSESIGNKGEFITYRIDEDQIQEVALIKKFVRRAGKLVKKLVPKIKKKGYKWDPDAKKFVKLTPDELRAHRMAGKRLSRKPKTAASLRKAKITRAKND